MDELKHEKKVGNLVMKFDNIRVRYGRFEFIKGNEGDLDHKILYIYSRTEEQLSIADGGMDIVGVVELNEEQKKTLNRIISKIH